MGKFPVDAPRHRVIRTPEALGFQMVREATHLPRLWRRAAVLGFVGHRLLRGKRRFQGHLVSDGPRPSDQDM